MPERTTAPDPEQRLDEAVTAFLEATESGPPPDPADWLRSYPDVADELADFFADEERFDRLVAPLRGQKSEDRGQKAASPTSDLCPLTSDRAGRVVGGYELLDEIGQGGMGVIYRARHRGLNRVVALKMLRAAAWALPADRQRLRWEAEAVARLDHPNIVPLYEVGEYPAGDGASAPFFSMKFVAGGSLDKHRDRLVGDWPAVARLLAAVARAVGHAHQRGILHRDLKPSNVLLAEDGTPYVTDFGLAKRLAAEHGMTRTGTAIGTPSYMAPEQAAGARHVTTAADVWSLGVILYELLTRRSPFRAETPLETMRQVLDREPPAPRTLDPQVPADLETITLKCLRKEPAKRYASAEALADDLERWLAGRPILARPVGTAERLWLWCRRQPLLAGLSAALAVAVSVGLPLLVWAWLRAARHEQVALESLAEARRQRELENESFRLAHQAVGELYTRIGEGRLAHVPGAQPVRRELLLAARRYYQAFLVRRGDDPQLRAELADIHFRIGFINGATGSLREAAAAYGHALAVLRELLRDDPTSVPLRLLFGRTLLNLGAIENERNRPAEAAAALQEAADCLARLAAERPTDPEPVVAQAKALNNLGNVLSGRGDLPEALATYRRAAALLTEQVRLGRARPDDRAALGDCQINVGKAEKGLGRPREAAAAFEQARGQFEELVKAVPQDARRRHNLALCQREIAVARTAAGALPAAEESARQALQILEDLVRQQPAVTDYRWTLALVYDDLGIIAKRRRRFDDALAAYQKARDLLRKLVDDDPEARGVRASLAGTCHNAGLLHLSAGRPADAPPLFVEARANYERLLAGGGGTPYDRAGLVHTLNDLAEALLQLKHPAEAAAALGPAVEHQRILLDRAPGDREKRKTLSSTLGNLAIALRAAGRPMEAVEATLRRQALWPDDAEELFDAARDFARSAAQLGPAPNRGDELALAALRAARAAGFRDRERLRTAPEFARLRDRIELVGEPRPW